MGRREGWQAMSKALESLRYTRGSLQVLDQLKVPQAKQYVVIDGTEAAWTSIRTMQVRGAPLIAMVAALGLAVEAQRERESCGGSSASAVAAWFKERTQRLRTSRPTAVNLFNAMDALDAVVDKAAADTAASAASTFEAYIVAAEAMLAEDVAANKALGDVGADAILATMEVSGHGGQKANVLTICNTGSLASGGWGTALGIVRSLQARGKLECVYALETRPYNQGARLTAFEILEDALPGTLVCDSMAASLMKRTRIDACVVGADRVAANGDTANKIGTYSLAVVANHHGVPFFVASPTSTLDPQTPSGAEIPIEERPADELTCLKVDGVLHRVAPEGITVWNPAFDVAPAELIAGIVTEKGLIPRERNAFDIPAFLETEGRTVCKKRKTD